MLHRRFSFQAKVLAPLVAVLVVLMVTSTWVVERRMSSQLQTDAAEQLQTADAVFHHSREIRARNLLLRYRNISREPRFKAITQLGDPRTTQEFLAGLLGEEVGDVAAYVSPDGRVLAHASRDPALSLSEFNAASLPAVRQALAGQGGVDAIRVGNRLFDVVAIPMSISGSVAGVLVFGEEIGAGAAQEIKLLTRSEIVFLAEGRVIAATLPQAEPRAALALFHAQLARPFGGTNGPTAAGTRPLELGGEHFLGAAGQFTTLNKEAGLGYLLLCSYEPALRAFRATEQVLWIVRLAGTGLGIALVWFVVRMLTRPLAQLRAGAEAVGRGDFSQRVQVASQDELGELALAFNQMTENLRNSREQLEKTVQTLQNTRARLTQSEKLSVIGEFVAGVAHELNNPLTSVIGFSELLQTTVTDPRHGQYLANIVRDAQRCGKIVQSLLSFSRQRPAERKRAALNDIVEAAVEILRYQLRTANVLLTVELDRALPDVMADKHQLQQVFVNLINNARQAMEGFRPEGHLRIRSEASPGKVRVIFQDDGPGISEENLAKIFTPFFTTKEVGKGTGLGLSLSYGIVHEHGGEISIRSQTGAGATFTVELPVAEAAGLPRTDETAGGDARAGRSSGLGKRVLVIDDEESILALAHGILSMDQYLVDTAPDGEAALQKLRVNRYDLLLCDLKMPGLSGPQVYEHLLQHDPDSAHRMLFMSGDVIGQGTEEFLRHSRKVCLPKPFSLDQLRQTLSQVFGLATSTQRELKTETKTKSVR